MNTLRILVFISLLSNLGAVTLWTEGIGGANDLSDDYLNPNAFTVGLGENLITAEVNSVETSPGVFAANQDFFTIIVPNDIQVTGLFLLGYSFDGAAGNKTFLGYQNGATLLQAPETFTQDTAGLIADLLFGSAEIVSDPFSYPFDPTETNLFDNFGDGDFATPAPPHTRDLRLLDSRNRTRDRPLHARFQNNKLHPCSGSIHIFSDRASHAQLLLPSTKTIAKAP